MPPAAILAGVLAVTSLNAERGLERVDVAYAELMNGHAAAAIARLSATRDRHDPMMLINLAAAHARLGHAAEARQLLQTAIASPERYDVELADGRWMDSRNAARIALDRLEGNVTVKVY